jgi:hypothetical protein
LLRYEDALRNATIREVSPAVFSSGSARSARRLYKATVQAALGSVREGVQETACVRSSLKRR